MHAIERMSFLLVIPVGAVLLWRALPGTGHTHGHHHEHVHEHEHEHEHEHDHSHAGHAHMPTPAELRPARGWRDMAAVILAVGLRPCTGAILVLLFALTQSAFLVGVLSALAMAIGTAITVSLLPVFTLLSINVALRLACTADNRWTGRIERGTRHRRRALHHRSRPHHDGKFLPPAATASALSKAQPILDIPPTQRHTAPDPITPLSRFLIQ